MDKFPEIETNRLVLAKVSFNDIPKIVEYVSNKKVAETASNIPHPYEEKDAVFWINAANQGFQDKSQFTFGIKTKTSEFVGGIDLKINKDFNRAELGYWIGQPFWNMGYATEAVGAILNFGFTKLNLNKIYATHFEENTASGKVMLKNGMIKEGELKEHTKKWGFFKNVIQYRLTKKEFFVGISLRP